MDGPSYLLLYAGVATAAIMGVRRYNRPRDVRAGEPLPPVPSPADPYELAWLRGGTAEATRLAVYDLRQRGLLKTPTPGSAPSANYVVAAHHADQQPGLPPLGRLLLRICVTPHHPSALFKGDAAIRMEEGCLHWRRRHEEHGFLVSQAQRTHGWWLLTGTGLVLLVVSAVRIQQSIAHGHHNLIFLILLTVAALIALPLVARPSHHLTPRGRRHLERIRLALTPTSPPRAPRASTHDSRLDSTPAARTDGPGPDPVSPETWSPASAIALVPVALLGMNAMNATDRQHMEHLFPQAAHRDQHSGSGSSCGAAGCGSASSSWGGSSSEGGESSGGGGTSDGGGGGCGGGGD